MTFVLRMALREIRASWQRLLFFFICIAVGVAAIVTIRSVIQSVRTGLNREARTLTGGDYLITSDREFTPSVLAAVERERRRRVQPLAREDACLPGVARQKLEEASRVLARRREL